MELEDYLHTCRELNLLCTQNGWIDNETLQVEVVERHDRSLLAAVTFEEIVMEGAGCIAGRVPCYGRVRVQFNETGDVDRLEVL